MSCNCLTPAQGVGALAVNFSIDSLNCFRMRLKNFWFLRSFLPCVSSSFSTASTYGAVVLAVDDKIGWHFSGSSYWNKKMYKHKLISNFRTKIHFYFYKLTTYFHLGIICGQWPVISAGNAGATEVVYLLEGRLSFFLFQIFVKKVIRENLQIIIRIVVIYKLVFMKN